MNTATARGAEAPPPRILALQLKRIGDLLLTLPALTAIRDRMPHAQITLGLTENCRTLLPAIDCVHRAVVLRSNGWDARDWTKILFQRFDVCLDFTGTDRSAMAALFSKARRRVAFAGVDKRFARSLIYNSFIESPVRDYHTIDHYCHLVRALDIDFCPPLTLSIPPTARAATPNFCDVPYVVIHPGTARAEKFWVSDRWAALITHIRERYGLECLLTGGSDALERDHIAEVQRALVRPAPDASGKVDLLGLATLIDRARACISCDTAAVHFAAALEKPQLALYGVTNPFH